MISMEIQQIEQNVDSLLSACGFKKDGGEQPVRVLLHHLYSAVAMYKEIGASERAVIAKTNKKFRSIYELNFNLKERKRNNKAKDGLSPTPSFKEKENKKEKVEKITHTKKGGSIGLDDDQLAFWEECKKFIGNPYDEEMIQKFFYYWAEKNRKSSKMLWQTKKTWNLPLRLASWSKSGLARNDEAAAIRLRKTKAKQVQEVAAAEHQESVAAIREQANIEREQAQEESKQGQMLTQDYIAQNPNGFLARCAREREAREKQKNKK